MTVALAGAFACALAVTSLVLAPAFRLPTFTSPIVHPDRNALRDAGWTRSLLTWEAIRAGAALLGLAIAAVFSLPAIPAMAAGALATSIIARARAERAVRRARAATTRILRITEAAVRSNAGVPEALRRAIGGCDDRLAARPFAGALRAFDLGAPLDEALRDAREASSDPRVRVALDTLALGVASRLPGDRAGALVSAVADRLAFHERLDDEVRARAGGLQVQVIVLAALVPALTIYLAVTVPSLASVLGSTLGKLVLIPAALLLEAIGILVSRRAVNGALR
jgi:Flp pilus assembly protein TadB